MFEALRDIVYFGNYDLNNEQNWKNNILNQVENNAFFVNIDKQCCEKIVNKFFEELNNKQKNSNNSQQNQNNGQSQNNNNQNQNNGQNPNNNNQNQNSENHPIRDAWADVGHAWADVGRGILQTGAGTIIDFVGDVTEVPSTFVIDVLNDENNQAGITMAGIVIAAVHCPPVAVGAAALTGVNFVGRLVNGEDVSLETLGKSVANTVKQTNEAIKPVFDVVINVADFVKESSKEVQEANKEFVNSCVNNIGRNDRTNENDAGNR